MTETQQILGRLTALRQRLEASAAPPAVPPGIGTLTRQIAAGADLDTRLEMTVKPLTKATEEITAMPRQLTARARRVLEQGRALLARLRPLADVFVPGEEVPALFDWEHPLSRFYRETTAITDTSLRLIPLLPPTASAQLRICEGLDGILADVGGRVRTLTAAVAEKQVEEDRINRLAKLLRELEAGQLVGTQGFLTLAEEEWHDVREGKPLRFLAGDPSQPERFVACHGLTTARVLARVARHDPELRSRPMELILATLVHDVGMLRVPPAILAQKGPLSDEQKRIQERHCHIGADLLAKLAPDAPWLAEAARSHHERMDGTGYPDGLRDGQLSPLIRLLAVCDMYAACCAARPGRPALETRTALADTLLLADQGLLDRDHAERLLHLTFYPADQAVELSDGSIGIVVAPGSGRDLNSAGRPTVAIMVDAQGEPLPRPRHLDLGHCDGHAIVRTLNQAERQAALGFN